jgi:hypothetical protein
VTEEELDQVLTTAHRDLLEHVQAAVAKPVLLGVSDIARERGVTRQRINDLSHHPAWPTTVPGAPGSPRRWWSTDVAAFFALERPPGRPRKDRP